MPAPEASAAAVNPAVELRDVRRRFGTCVALDGINLRVGRGEFLSLLGPSGCGKTTALRLIAGLDLPDSGTILLAGRDADGIPAHRRPVNTVFQSYALFPHLTVRENVAFGLRMAGVPKDSLLTRVARVMELVQITDLGDRRPVQISGGQKQRVALARALVNEPEVLLLDEPLAALDAKLRRQLQVELRALQRSLGITFLLVTHDQDEALALSDRIAVMNAGRIEQLGGPGELYERPRTRFVAQFLGACNLIEGSIASVSATEHRVSTTLGELRVVSDGTVRVLSSRVCLAIRPERVRLQPSSQGAENTFAARLESCLYCGADTQFTLDAGSRKLEARLLNLTPTATQRNVGEPVTVQLPPEALMILED